MSSASWAREGDAEFYEKRIFTQVGPQPETETTVASSDVVPPGELCPLCGEKTPSEAALKMREWRAKRGAD